LKEQIDTTFVLLSRVHLSVHLSIKRLHQHTSKRYSN